MTYSSIRTTAQFDKLLKTLYILPKGKIVEFTVPAMKYLTISGKGSPDDKSFRDAIQLLYGVAFTLRFGLKFGKLPKPKGWFDYKVSALEGLWWAKGGFEKVKSKKQFEWKLLVLVPAFINAASVAAAAKLARTKRSLPYNRVELETWAEGRVIQKLHIGPYNKEKVTTSELMVYAKNNKRRITGKHHEIYLSDPRRTPASKLKTVIRYGVS